MAQSLSDLIGEDIVDSRDLIEALGEYNETDESEHDAEEAALAAEVRALDENPPCPDWPYGEALIHDRYFRDYAEALAEDIGAIDGTERWPACHIDWDAAAEALKADYTDIEIGGHTYWVRG